MAVQMRGNVTAMQVGKTEGSFFPLIPHVSPIWPLGKRIEKAKTRKVTYWRLVRNKMIMLRFLQSINPAVTDLFSKVLDEEEKGSNIVTLTRNFEEEQRKKHERIYEIQMEAYLRAATKRKRVLDKARESDFATDLRTTRESLSTRKMNSTNLTSQSLRLTNTNRTTMKTCNSRQGDIHLLHNKGIDTSANSQQRKSNSQTFRSLNGEFGSPGNNGEQIHFPRIYQGSKCSKMPMNDPRFQRLLNSLIPSPDKKEKDNGIRTNESRSKGAAETGETVSKVGFSPKSLQDKRTETMAPINNDKNSIRRNKSKFTRPVAGRWHSV